MPLPQPEPGLVISYAYLWRHEHGRGLEEVAKTRPCAIVLATRSAGDADLMVIVAPITRRPPDHEHAIEIPAATKRRLGLDAERSRVITDEVNRFIWPGPDLRPVSRARPTTFAYGMLPPALFRKVRDQIVALARQSRLPVTARGR